MSDDFSPLVQRLLQHARQKGADGAEVFLENNATTTYTCRMGKDESFERAEQCRVALRILIGQQQALVSTADLRPDALDSIVESAIVMARNATQDPFCGLADHPPPVHAAQIAQLDLVDDTQEDKATLRDHCLKLEDNARAVQGVDNSEGAQMRVCHTQYHIATNRGLDIAYQTSRRDIALSVIAAKGDDMEREYVFRAAVHADNFGKLEALGKHTGEEAVRRLGSKKIDTAERTVIYHPRVANTLLKQIEEALKGDNIARGTSFLKDHKGQSVMGKDVHIIDDPTRPQGLRSRPCDCEGIIGQKRALVDGGVVTDWLLDDASARKLKRQSTGHAWRNVPELPHPQASNLYWQPGPSSPEDMIASVHDGLYVTELLGLSFNLITGDYSRGASGFRIENGKMTYPVSEVTIAGNLITILRDAQTANDLEFIYEFNAPTILIPSMIVSGR